MIAIAAVAQALVIAAGAWFAWRQIRSAQKTAARTNTIQHVLSLERDRDAIKQRDVWLDLRNRHARLEIFLERGTSGARGGKRDRRKQKPKVRKSRKRRLKEAAAIRGVLNRYEALAIGIEKQILDDAIFKRFHRTTVVRDWIFAKPYIVELRRKQRMATLYDHFERLAKSWARDDEWIE